MRDLLLAWPGCVLLAVTIPAIASAQSPSSAVSASNGGGFDSHLFRPAMDSRGLFSTPVRTSPRKTKSWHPIATRSTDHRGRRGTAELAVRSSASASTSDRRYNGIVRIRIGPATYLRSVNGRLTDGGGPTPFVR